uniref:Uncharacterized protein n=1 Tax=Glossina pallidipes TaxID=7398 RepID=A0A1A9ZCH3_GLOPL
MKRRARSARAERLYYAISITQKTWYKWFSFQNSSALSMLLCHMSVLLTISKRYVAEAIGYLHRIRDTSCLMVSINLESISLEISYDREVYLVYLTACQSSVSAKQKY